MDGNEFFKSILYLKTFHSKDFVLLIYSDDVIADAFLPKRKAR